MVPCPRVIMAHFQRLRTLLSEAVECLPTTTSSTSSPSVAGPSSSSSSLTQTPSVLASNDLVQRTRSERNSLFNFGVRRPNMLKRPVSKSVSKTKKKKLSYWTHDFVCLASKNQDKTPTSFERSTLVTAGNLNYKVLTTRNSESVLLL